MKIEITDQQKIKKTASKYLRSVAGEVADILFLPDKRLSFLLCDDLAIKKLNKKFFKRDVPTDVIAFPLDDDNYFGEIIISVERAVKAAPEFGNSWHDEFATYIIHGVLHILGYDDTTPAKKRVMFKKQDTIIKKLKGKSKNCGVV